MITYKVTVDELGDVRWYNENDKLHRLDGPAVECADGHKIWWNNDKIHRLDGHAVEWPDGTKEWWVNDKLHRLDGPAIEYANGDKTWYQNGRVHRLDGPAFECPDGYKEWYIESIEYTEEQFLAKIESMNRPCNGKKVTVEGVEYTLA